MMQTKDKLGMLAAWGILLLTVELLAHASQDSSDKAERNSAIRRDYYALTDSIEKLLANESDCTASLRGSKIAEPIDVRDPSDTSKILAAVGDYHPIGWTITKLELKNVESFTSDEAGAARLRADEVLTYGELYIEIRKEMASAVGAPIFTRKIGDLVFEAAQGKIQRCI